MRMAYPAKFEHDEDRRVLVTFRDLPEAHTDGADMAEALAEAADCLDSVLSFRMKYREPILAPSKARKGEVEIAPSATVAMKAALHMAMTDRNLTTRALAKSRTYSLYQGRKKVYIGEAADPERRAEQHRQEGKDFNRVEATSRPMLKKNAQKREAEQLEAYRRGHRGRNPRYNETDEG